MELNEFLETFGVRMGQIEAMSKENIDGFSFEEALQNFADKICEKQRINCRENWVIAEDYKDEYIKIETAEQPKIDEL
jgi:hypothetical protein